MNNKLLMVVLLIGSVLYLFKDKVDLDGIFKPDPDTPAVVVTVEREPTAEMKGRVQPLVTFVKNSNASTETKKITAQAWFGAADVWGNLRGSTLTSDKVVAFNNDLLTLYSERYPQIRGAFPGQADITNQLFAQTLGEYPTSLDEAGYKKVSELCNAIGWAYTQ